jgi:peptidoglycan/LPS O-acetylase OafA/YrhL
MAIQYRPEIDGLRALAILPVIFFHAGFSFFKGGFVGVDIFFVISGYLITSIILNEKASNNFSLANFYERRARRILPALLLVMLISIPFAWWLLMPYDMWSFCKSLGYALASIANILFNKENGYFAASSLLKPFIHSWSLGVEEQYYWLFPLILIFIWKYIKPFIFWIFLVIAIASLLYSQYLLSFKNSDAAFYLLPSRIWELLFGALIAAYIFNHKDFHLKNKSPLFFSFISFLGLLLIIFSIIFLDETIAFPGFNALLPTIGTSLIILYASPKNFAGKWLAKKPLVFIGLISYSAYLWHQPLLAFTRSASINQPNKIVFLFISLLSLALGFLSWKYIEVPCRNKNKVSRCQFFTWIGILSSIILLFGFIGYKNEGYPYRVASYLDDKFKPQNNLSLLSKINRNITWQPSWISDKKNFKDDTRQSKLKTYSPINGFPNIKAQYFGDLNSKNEYVIYGDSHADNLPLILDEPFKALHIKGVHIFINGCHTIPEIVNAKHNHDMRRSLSICEASFDQFSHYVKNRALGLMVASRWTIKLFPLEKLNDKQPFDNGEGGVELDWRPEKFMVLDNQNKFTFSQKDKENIIKDFIVTLDNIGKPVILIYPIPEVGWSIKRLNFQRYMLGQGKINEDVSTLYKRYKERNAFIISTFDSVNTKHITRIRPDKVLCDTFIKDRCAAQLGSTMLYDDDDHLSFEGSLLLKDSILKQIHFLKH